MWSTLKFFPNVSQSFAQCTLRIRPGVRVCVLAKEMMSHSSIHVAFEESLSAAMPKRRKKSQGQPWGAAMPPPLLLPPFRPSLLLRPLAKRINTFHMYRTMWLHSYFVADIYDNYDFYIGIKTNTHTRTHTCICA